MKVFAKRLLWRVRRALVRPGRADVPPSALSLRDATLQDARVLAELHVKTFNETHGGPFGSGPSVEFRERQWREKLPQTSPTSFVLLLESPAGVAVGFAWVHDTNEHPDFQVRLNKIYLLRAYQRLGLGKRMLREVLTRVRGAGTRSIILFTEPENVVACRFCESLGAEKVFAFGGGWSGAYGWRDLGVLEQRLPTR